MRKYRNFETSFFTFKNELKIFLNECDFYHEISKNGLFYHFEIFCNDEEAKTINEWITTNTIQEIS